jgi:hypothetical protein
MYYNLHGLPHFQSILPQCINYFIPLYFNSLYLAAEREENERRERVVSESFKLFKNQLLEPIALADTLTHTVRDIWC